MRYLIVTDIHGNLPALEAVLATPEAAGCSRCISLGDHCNWGPFPRQVPQRLLQLDALVLLGNHEERLRHLDEPSLSGYNWRMLHWTAAQLRGMPVVFPVDHRLGPVWCTHGTPGDPYHLVDAESVRPVLAELPPEVTLLLSGHHHIHWQVSEGGRTAFNPGSLGMNEEGQGGVAHFALLDLAPDGWEIRRCQVPYDLQALRRGFRESGLLGAAPELGAAALRVMETGENHVLRLIRQVEAEAKRMGLGIGDEAPWKKVSAR